ncbi:MAG: hypothetical protein QXU40_01450 [Candidatus Pacearchaeota archaeon]
MSLLDQLKAKQAEEAANASTELTNGSAKRRNRELTQEEVKEGKWEEYQKAVEELKVLAEKAGLSYLSMISPINKKYFTSNAYKSKAMLEFESAKSLFDTEVEKAISKFQEKINELAKKYGYDTQEGELPKVKRATFIKEGASFRKFLSSK